MLVEFVTPADQRQHQESQRTRDAKQAERDAERMKKAFEKAGGTV